MHAIKHGFPSALYGLQPVTVRQCASAPPREALWNASTCLLVFRMRWGHIAWRLCHPQMLEYYPTIHKHVAHKKYGLVPLMRCQCRQCHASEHGLAHMRQHCPSQVYQCHQVMRTSAFLVALWGLVHVLQ